MEHCRANLLYARPSNLQGTLNISSNLAHTTIAPSRELGTPSSSCLEITYTQCYKPATNFSPTARLPKMQELRRHLCLNFSTTRHFSYTKFIKLALALMFPLFLILGLNRPALKIVHNPVKVEDTELRYELIPSHHDGL